MSLDRDAMKRAAGVRAVDEVQSGMAVGLGTGTTSAFAIRELAARLADGRLRDVVGSPTSEHTGQFAASLGIPLADINDALQLDLYIDGADEVDPHLNLIKGLGGALLREKIVASASRRIAIIADATKRVQTLGTHAPLPVEVDRFGWKTHLAFLRALGAEPVLRVGPDGAPFLTDGGHYILDCRFAAIEDPANLASRLQAKAGIVGHGLFLGMADVAIIGGPDGVDRLERE